MKTIEPLHNMRNVIAPRHALRFAVKNTVFKTLWYLLLAAVSFFFLFPFIVMFTRAFMTDLEVRMIEFFPSNWFNFDNFKKAFDLSFVRYLKNTVIVVAVNIIAVPLSCSLCAYGFAKMKFPGRKFCFAFMLSTMMLPFVVTQIPMFVIYVKLGWVNSLLPLTVPAFFGGGALNIFLMRQFMRGIPKEMSESARIDGANHLLIYLRIVLPLCKPIIALIMVQTFMGVWNDFLGPLLYIREEAYMTLPLGVFNKYNGNTQFLGNTQMAAGLLMMIPCAILFFAFQKQLIEGIMIGGVKG
ncbi:carbohydrate ABC transporter permease [Pumilibacter intestinalis]|uniref:carbohydrate ABC transporter permease n=1 Tax=Pumilibacter intestinalis TaxID=2941511 RepID=UPI00203C97E1|nr:carbohydrate ABC transporter permease [Pumilibacter intestinalis]